MSVLNVVTGHVILWGKEKKDKSVDKGTSINQWDKFINFLLHGVVIDINLTS